MHLVYRRISVDCNTSVRRTFHVLIECEVDIEGRAFYIRSTVSGIGTHKLRRLDFLRLRIDRLLAGGQKHSKTYDTR